jgi:hypothetical protein
MSYMWERLKGIQEQKKLDYQVAISQYQNEVNLINQRNSAFVTVQSILFAALAVFLVQSYPYFPYALVPFICLLAIGGSLFCFFHNYTGRLGATAALHWKRYIIKLEKELLTFPDTPYKTLYKNIQEHQWITERMPLPHVWIVIPSIFWLGWVAALAYILSRLYLNASFWGIFGFTFGKDPIQNNIENFLGSKGISVYPWIAGIVAVIFVIVLVLGIIISCVAIHKYRKNKIDTD